MAKKDISYGRLVEMCGKLVDINSGLLPRALTDEEVWEAFSGSFNATEEVTKKRVFELWNTPLSPEEIFERLDDDMKNKL